MEQVATGLTGSRPPWPVWGILYFWNQYAPIAPPLSPPPHHQPRTGFNLSVPWQKYHLTKLFKGTCDHFWYHFQGQLWIQSRIHHVVWFHSDNCVEWKFFLHDREAYETKWLCNHPDPGNPTKKAKSDAENLATSPDPNTSAEFITFFNSLVI